MEAITGRLYSCPILTSWAVANGFPVVSSEKHKKYYLCSIQKPVVTFHCFGKRLNFNMDPLSDIERLLLDSEGRFLKARFNFYQCVQPQPVNLKHDMHAK
eukprot:scaffold2918_cov230-Alexandrium_tamarense.AAC.13